MTSRVIKERSPRPPTRLRESLEISWTLRLDWMVVEDLFFLADVARRAGRLSDAARLFGAAERLRETIGHALFGNVPMVVEASTAATRLALGAEEFAVAWEGGHALLGEQAVATALEVADALAAEHGDDSGSCGFRRDTGSF